METKEITPDSLAEALRRCNLVFDINKEMRKIEKLKKELKKLSKKDEIIIFSEQVNFKIIEAATSGRSYTQRNAIIDKIEIDCDLSSKDIFLNLNLYSGVYHYSFLFAKNKGSDAGYLVQTKKDELLIMDGGNRSVEFSSAEDFKKVINYCDEYLAKFNSFLKGEKLIPHFNERIYSVY